MITRKEFPNHKIFKTMFAGQEISVEFGKFAELTNMSCTVRMGDTVVMANVVASALPKEGIDYFPLTVEFEEKIYAAGRIPGSFTRREGRPGEKATLAGRLIDRPMRPLFDSYLRNDVVLTLTVLSVDPDVSPEIPAMIAASICVACSDIPWNGPIAGCVAGLVDGEIVLMPNAEQREKTEMIITTASTDKKVVMIETEANQIPEDIIYDGIMACHEESMKIVEWIKFIVTQVGKPKFSFVSGAIDEGLLTQLKEEYLDQIRFAMDTDDKNVREERLTPIKVDIIEKYSESWPNIADLMDEIMYKLQKVVVRAWLHEGKRVDGRRKDEIRPLAAEVSLLPRTHGSGLFTRGQTQVLSICTLDTLSAAQKLDNIWPETEKRYMHQYNFPGYSTGEAKPSRSVSRREIGHGALAEKALVPVLPSVEEFPYAIRVVSEVLSSNGSTSQGSICGSTLALMDAGVPIKAPVAGISCGLITEGDDDFTTFIDIQGVEDFHGEMDFKVAGTKKGVTAIQMDLKNEGLTGPIIREALTITRDARYEILDEIMVPCIGEPRAEVSKYAPKMLSMKIDPEKIREVIGSGGKVIQKIVADTGAKIDIEDDGSVFISSISLESCMAAKKTIENIVFVPEIGKLYYGKCVRIIPIGAFIELVPGKDGMCHIKDLEFKRTEKVEDVIKEGDYTWVKVTEIDDRGRVNLSRKLALKEMREKELAEQSAAGKTEEAAE
ncbi:MAG: polyribonucleotide nucleotidyltransferase [Oscillospiraceae bacterium]|nr:polyribonucleotide nucleotidyltransferase [Oscillospiraceae bacterium]